VFFFLGLAVAEVASRFTQRLMCAPKWMSSNSVYSGVDEALAMKLRCQATYHCCWWLFPVTRRRLMKVLNLVEKKGEKIKQTVEI
jgi:hypothetical protein